MKRKYTAFFIILLAAMTSCASEKTTVRPESAVPESRLDDFITYDGPYMTAAPEGYFAVNGSAMTGYFLYYITPDFKKSTIVCNELECAHNDTDVQNHMEYLECNAYLTDAGANLDYYNGYLYIMMEDYTTSAGSKDILYRVSTDGTDKTVWYEPKQFVRGFCIYGDLACVAEEQLTAEGVKHSITTFPVEEPEKAKTIYETSEYPNRTLNRMKCYGGNCYFYLYDPEQTLEGQQSVYLFVNLQTGEGRQLYEPASVWIEQQDYGTLYEFKEYTSYRPETWNSTYYRSLSGSQEMQKLTEADFLSVGEGDTLSGVDDRYIYFTSIHYGGNALPAQEQKLRVYDYEGGLTAEIPSGAFGEMYHVLPGTDRYLFVQKVNRDGSYAYYYVDKEDFAGETAEAHEIPFEKRG